MSTDQRFKDIDTRIRAELVDSFDEELEMELDDERLDILLGGMEDRPETEGMDRKLYFKELFRLQGELVKLQDWVDELYREDKPQRVVEDLLAERRREATRE